MDNVSNLRRRSFKLEFKRQKSFEYFKRHKSFDYSYLRQKSKTENDTGLRRVQSCKQRRNSIRRAKVIHRLKSRRRITVTLSSPEKSPSPDILKEFEIEVKGAKVHVKKALTPKEFEKAYNVFLDEQTKAEIILKENEKEVENISFQDLLDSKIIHCREMKVTASDPKWSLPDIRVFDNEHDFFSEKEQDFLRKRKLFIKSALMTKFKDQEEFNGLDDIPVPHIAVMGSGGGYRAMVSMSGIFNALYDTKILDYILYTAALSGSSWFLAVLYSHPDFPNINPKEIQQKLKKDISKNPKKVSNFLYYCGSYISKRWWNGLKWNLTTDAFSPLLGHILLSDRLECRWSEQSKKVEMGEVPLPLLSAINAKDEENTKKFHEWVEFSPYEVTIPKYGAAINMKDLGSEFEKGALKKKNKEPPLHEIMGICGSAFTLTYEEWQSKDGKNLNMDKSKDMDIIDEFGGEDVLDGPCSNKRYPRTNAREKVECLNHYNSSSRKQSKSSEYDVLDGGSCRNDVTYKSYRQQSHMDVIDIVKTERKAEKYGKLKGEVLDTTLCENDKLDGNSVRDADKDVHSYIIKGINGMSVRNSRKSFEDNMPLNNGYLESQCKTISSESKHHLSNTSESDYDEFDCSFRRIKLNSCETLTKSCEGLKLFDDVDASEEGEDVFDIYPKRSIDVQKNNKSARNINEGQRGCDTDADPSDDDMKDLEESFAIISSILENEGRIFEKVGNEEDKNQKGPCNDTNQDQNCVGSDQGTDQLDGAFTEVVKKWITSRRKHRAASVNNFMRKVSFDETDGSLPQEDKGNLFENYMKRDLEKLYLIDAGLAFNSPYPLLFRPGRDVDLILSFDFTDRKKDKNPPFKTLLRAEEWARKHEVKFPEIKTNVKKFQNKEVQELYVFEDENDIDCPMIMHFVLVNKDFREYKKPNVKRDESERSFADFNIFDDQSTYHCFNFHYTSENFDRLSQLSEFIVLNNLSEIEKCIKKSISNRIKRAVKERRQRHPTT